MTDAREDYTNNRKHDETYADFLIRQAREMLDAATKVYEWMREPDWAEEWNIYDWATRRPVKEIRSVMALIAEMEKRNG